MSRLARVICLGALVALVAGCSLERGIAPAEKVPENELRIGVTTTYPPIIFRTGGPRIGTVTGVEAELAQHLGQALKRPIRFVEVRWPDQIPVLLEGQTDIIMSGMTITRERQVRVAFAQPYLKTGLAVALRTADGARFGSRARVMATEDTVGVIENTTADTFVQRSMPRARRYPLALASDGALMLKRRTIDVFIHDAPSIMWLVSSNEADLQGMWELLDEEHLAWAMRREDTALLDSVNAVLETWKKDGTLEAVLTRWLPFRR
jgi:polar amino acid transport system substrate-binding protein